ncbi:MAG: carboxypeptidase regulatory-like domain-containing protein [Candidatus Brockarchaeota archaeon]|nr:carboxypeptidase regulatory-like domain-containing protein [Candidatus Brockarchaeota archaeon]
MGLKERVGGGKQGGRWLAGPDGKPAPEAGAKPGGVFPTVLTAIAILACSTFGAAHASPSTPAFEQKITLLDNSSPGKPIAGATLEIHGVPWTLTTGTDGSVKLGLVPAGRIEVTVTWKSAYNPEPVTIARSTITIDRDLDAKVVADVYDVELKILSRTGNPVANAEVWLAGVPLGATGADGVVRATQVPGWHEPNRKPYPVTAYWFGADVSPGEVNVTSTGTYVLTAKNVATLTVRVVGAQGQGLGAAQVEIKTSSGIAVFSGVSNEQGVVSVEVPYGNYDVRVEYKGFENAASATVDAPTGTVLTVATSVFAEAFGIAMSFGTFALWMVAASMVVLMIAVAIHEYHVYRRKKLPQLFGVPKVKRTERA